jgi:glycosyltransferase involved in cell wall biosynthesis
MFTAATNSSNSVDILLSTYNGSSFLEPQIESLFAQSYKEWRLLVRDDGSTDSTVELLEKYEAKHPDKIVLLKGSPAGSSLGPTLSFSRLLENSTAEYSLFCDQDDVWESSKIEVTLERMQKIEAELGEIPILVHTDLKVVGTDLSLLSPSFWKYQNLDPTLKSLKNLLLLNNVTGSTAMVNRPLRLLAAPIPAEAVLHDWWVAIVASAFGYIGYVETPTVLYRQHGANVAGSTSYSAGYFLSRLRSLGRTTWLLRRIVAQAAAFLALYKEKFVPMDLKMVTGFAVLLSSSRAARLGLLLKHGFKGTGLLRNAGIYLLLLSMSRAAKGASQVASQKTAADSSEGGVQD